VADPLLQVRDQHAERHPEDAGHPFVIVQSCRTPLVREQIADRALADPEALGELALRPPLLLTQLPNPLAEGLR